MFNPLKIISKFIKSGNQKELDRIGKIVNDINNLETKYSLLNNEDFPKETKNLKDKIKSGEKLNKIGIRTIEDLLFHLPIRYQDKTKIAPNKDLKEGRISEA